MATSDELLDRIERLRAAMMSSDDPFVQHVLRLAMEALEEAIAETGNEGDQSSLH